MKRRRPRIHQSKRTKRTAARKRDHAWLVSIWTPVATRVKLMSFSHLWRFEGEL